MITTIKHIPPTMMPIRANILQKMLAHIKKTDADKAYGKFRGPLSFSGGFSGDCRPNVWVALPEVEGGNAAGVTLGPPRVQSELELGCTFCIAEVSLLTAPVAGSLLSYKNIKVWPWGTEVLHNVLLPVDTPFHTAFNLKASPPST